VSRDAAHPGAGLKGKAQRNAPAGPDDEHAISPSLPEAPAGPDTEVRQAITQVTVLHRPTPARARGPDLPMVRVHAVSTTELADPMPGLTPP
jgi:hypothetical protein